MPALLICLTLSALEGDGSASSPSAQAAALAKLSGDLGSGRIDADAVIRKADFNDQALLELVPLLRGLPTVRSLDLTRTKVTPAGLKQAFAKDMDLGTVSLHPRLADDKAMKALMEDAYMGFYIFLPPGSGPGTFSSVGIMLGGGTAPGKQPRIRGIMKAWLSKGFSADELKAIQALEKTGAELRFSFSFDAGRDFNEQKLDKAIPTLRALPAASVELSLLRAPVGVEGVKKLVGVKSLSHLQLTDAQRNRKVIEALQTANHELSIGGAFVVVGNTLPGVGPSPTSTAPQPTKPKP